MTDRSLQAVMNHSLQCYRQSHRLSPGQHQVCSHVLACRTPVITTRGVDIWRELQDSGGAVIVDSDPDALAAAIRGLLDDPDELQAMGRRARSWVLETLEPDRVIEQYYTLYGSEKPVTLPGGHRQTS